MENPLSKPPHSSHPLTLNYLTLSPSNSKPFYVLSPSHSLELLRPDDSGKVVTLHSVEVFGAIRSLVPFRLTGFQKDYLAIGSDSGRLVILEYSKERNCFDKVHQETFGKFGCRRIVPGQFLAVDPKGCALVIAACEKHKLVYVLNRDTVARLKRYQ